MATLSVSDYELQRIGAEAKELPPISLPRTPINSLPPIGAGRLKGIEGDDFVWEPFQPDEWTGLSDLQRGQIIVERSIGWLAENAIVISAPVSFVSVPDEQMNKLFGIRAHNVHQALCATYRRIVASEGVDLAVAGLASIGLISSGAHLAAISLDFTLVVVKEYGRRRCKDSA